MYFNHAFHKMFLGTGDTITPVSPVPSNPATNNGFVLTQGTPTIQLAKLSQTTGKPGYFGFFDPNTWTLVNQAGLSGNNCCPLVLASASLLTNDKIGPFAGGYKESNKSKIIKPKHITRFYRVDPCLPQQTVVSIGNTPYTDDSIVSLVIDNDGAFLADGTYENVLLGGGVDGAIVNIVVSGGEVLNVHIVNAGSGYTTGDLISPVTDLPGNGLGVAVQPVFEVTAGIGQNCCKEFLCDETYYIRIDVKGSPALRFLNHNAYWNIYYYTGCCNDQTPPISPNFVDSTLVMRGFAEQIVDKVPLQNFIYPVVYDESGVAWFPPGKTVDPDGNPVTESQWWNNYVSTGHTPGACAGVRLFGAYVDTVFQDCTFQPTDFFMKEPLKILASEVDQNGDPCTFSGLCVVTECPGRQGMGFGDTVAKELILSESYLQNFFHSDLRIREITQGNQILSAVSRTEFYTRYVILHNVPRYNNPSGTYDNDQYALEIITQVPGMGPIPIPHTSLENFMNAWLTACGDCVELEVFSCGECVTVPAQPELP